MFDARLLEAWAANTGCDLNDERVRYPDECGWPRDFSHFRAGWEAARTVEPTPEKSPASQTRAEIFQLATIGGDRNLIEARDLIHAMTPEERRLLRMALERLDDLLDAVVIELRMAKLQRRPNE